MTVNPFHKITGKEPSLLKLHQDGKLPPAGVKALKSLGLLEQALIQSASTVEAEPAQSKSKTSDS